MQTGRASPKDSTLRASRISMRAGLLPAYRIGRVSPVLRSWHSLLLCLTLLFLHVADATLGPGLAADPDRLLFIRPEDQRSVLFAAVDAGRSVFLTAGSKQTLVAPLDRSGFVIMETSGFGLTRETTWREGAQLPTIRLTTQTSVIVGHQWNLDRLYLAGFIGPEILHEQLTIAGQAFRFSEPRYGAKAQFELWSNPTPNTLLTGSAVGTTTNMSLWVRGSAGIRIWSSLYAGPELAAYATRTYQETKVGAHVTGFQLGIVQGRVSAGWMMTDEKRPGSPYLSATAWIRM